VKFALFTPHAYERAEADWTPGWDPSWAGWPGAPQLFEPERALRSHRRMLELCQLADETGFDWITLAEHHYSEHMMMPSPMLLAAELSQRLRRARLAVLGVAIPLTNPVRVAEEYALLDLMTGGRLAMAGFLRGTPNEYLTYGTDAAHSREMYEEGIELVVAAWTTPVAFGWEGRHYQNRLISIWPRPVQQPHPPVLVSGNSPDSADFAARHRFSIGLAFLPPQAAVRSAAYFREAAAAAGWAAAPENIVYRTFAYVAATDEQAQRDCAEHGFGALSTLGGGLAAQAPGASRYAAALADVGRRYNGPAPAAGAPAAAAPGGAGAPAGGARPGGARPGGAGGVMPGGRIRPPLCGSPETVLRQVRELRDSIGAGVLDLILYNDALPHELARESVRLFGTEVIPQARDL
jgi:alkanesulfonate monooxygenase SsuD/methylene tetrahydromethanopterin reductase-like flavin-dependent oxidoreductase (luciferase family)